jgi:hypothetical protein
MLPLYQAKRMGNQRFEPISHINLLNLHTKLYEQYQITKFSFETGHALYGYDGKCKNVHGHSYKLSVTVIGSPIENRNDVKFGMVIDFTDLKIVKEKL